MSHQPPQYITEEDYLAFDLASEFKNEYANGQIYMMAGASPTHSAIGCTLSLDEVYRNISFEPETSTTIKDT
ncbi:MAG: hypothetical protein ACPG7F_17090 [Aggregatilineales bacterium]